MHCPDINKLTIKADFSSYQNKLPGVVTDTLHDQRQEWWYTMKMIPPFSDVDSIDTTITTTSSSAKVGFLFQNNNIAYRVLKLSDDNIYCYYVIVGEDSSDSIRMEIATIKSYIEEQNK